MTSSLGFEDARQLRTPRELQLVTRLPIPPAPADDRPVVPLADPGPPPPLAATGPPRPASFRTLAVGESGLLLMGAALLLWGASDWQGRTYAIGSGSSLLIMALAAILRPGLARWWRKRQ